VNNSQPMSNDKATEMINRIASEGGFIRMSIHMRNDRREERNAFLPDLRRCLSIGIVTGSEWDADHADWKYRVEGEDLDGYGLTAITVVIPANFALFVITVME
jgi:hypothetical protein